MQTLENSLGILYNPTSNFRIQNQKIFLTYMGTHLQKDIVRTYFQSRYQGYKQIEIAHENGAQGNTPHTHILIDFGRLYQSKDARIFDLPMSNGGSIHPNIRKITTQSYWTNCLNYLAKEDPECSNLKILSPVQAIWNCNSMEEALSKVTHLNQVMPTIAVMNLKPRPMPEYTYSHFPWQEELIAHLETKTHPRELDWYFDSFGDSGKSEIATYLMSISPKYLIISECGGMRDFATTIVGAMDRNNWTGHACIFDFPRGTESKSIYTPMEAIKDGRVTSTKYQGKTQLLPYRPHVIILCNFLPIFDAVIPGRWRIRIINEDRTATLITLPEARALKQIIDDHKEARKGALFINENTEENLTKKYSGFRPQILRVIIHELLPEEKFIPLSIPTSSSVLAPRDPAPASSTSSSSSSSSSTPPVTI